jgi:hypothetical protein
MVEFDGIDHDLPHDVAPRQNRSALFPVQTTLSMAVSHHIAVIGFAAAIIDPARIPSYIQPTELKRKCKNLCDISDRNF